MSMQNSILKQFQHTENSSYLYKSQQGTKPKNMSSLYKVQEKEPIIQINHGKKTQLWQEN